MNSASLVPLVYILASVLFAFGLKFLASPETARRGNQLSAIGMLLAVLATLTGQHIIGYLALIMEKHGWGKLHQTR